MRATVTRKASLRVSRCYHTPGAAPGSALEGNASELAAISFGKAISRRILPGRSAAATPSGNPGGENER